MELFVHRDEKEEVALVEVEGNAVVAAFVEEHGGAKEVELWLEDGDDPLDQERTLVEVGIVDHARVHIGKRAKIDTSVTYNHETKTREFGRGSTFKRVFDWATSDEVFPMTPDQKAKHTLEIAGTDVEPDMTARIGSYATDDKLHLKLVQKDRPNG